MAIISKTINPSKWFGDEWVHIRSFRWPYSCCHLRINSSANPINYCSITQRIILSSTYPSIPPSIEIQSGSPFINLDGPILEVELGVKLDLIPETKNFELKSVHFVQDKRKRGSPDLRTDSDVPAEFDYKDSHKKSAPSVS